MEQKINRLYAATDMGTEENLIYGKSICLSILLCTWACWENQAQNWKERYLILRWDLKFSILFYSSLLGRCPKLVHLPYLVLKKANG